MQNTSPAEVHFGVGVDTARYGHHASFLDENKRTAAKSFHFTESAQGYRKFQATLDRLARKHQSVHFHIRIDAAGQYAENFLQWVHQLPWPKTISVGQPARNKAYRKVHYDKRKADPAESMACARFAIVERPDPTPHDPPEFQQLRDVVALVEAASKHHTRLVNQLHGLLARVFPELAVHVTDISAQWVLTLLDKYPTPQKLALARWDTLIRIPHLEHEMARTLQEAAKESQGSSQGLVAEELVRRKVHALRQQQAESATVQKLMEQAWHALPEGPYSRILTIKGIGLQTAAALVAKIVTIERFSTASALIGYFGVFPEEIDVSGTDRSGNPKQAIEKRMSRKGNDLVRRLLYTAAQAAVKWNPPVRALFARLRADGKDYNTAIGHCMAKLLRQVFALWKKDCDFDPRFETPETTEVGGDETQKGAGHKAVEPPRKVVTTPPSSIAQSVHPDKLPPLNFALLRERVSMTSVLEYMSWQPKSRRGAQWRGACPFHEATDATTRSFAVNTQKKVYCCHRCGCEGNVLDLWIAFRGKPILSAGWDMVATFNIDPPLMEERPPGANH